MQETTPTFEITISRGEGKYSISAGGLNTQLTDVEFVWPPIDMPDADQIIPKLHTDVDLTKAKVQQIGARLFDSLITGKLRRRYDMLQGSGLKFRIRLLVEPSELATLPWEFMYDDEAGYLGLRPDQPLVRISPNSGIAEPIPVTEALRVLFVGASPIGTEPLGVAADEHYLREILAPLQANGSVRLLDPPLMNATSSLLHERLMTDKPHVLHYSGHGGFSKENATAYLALEEEGTNHKLDMVDAEAFAKILSNRDVRLVVLSACETATADPRNPFVGLAQQLILSANLSAVVAMQFPIHDSLAMLFNRFFYQVLATRDSNDPLLIDRAVAEGRKAIFDELKDVVAGRKLAEWAAPVLFSISDNANPWVEPVHEDRAIREAFFWDDAAKVRDNPERLIARAEVFARIDALLHQPEPEQVVIHGFTGTGKTALAASLAADHIKRGKGPVIWLEVGNEQPAPLLEALARALTMNGEIKPNTDMAAQVRDAFVNKSNSLRRENQVPLVVLDNVLSGPTLNRLDEAIPRTIPLLVTSRHKLPLRESTLMELTDFGERDAPLALCYFAGKSTLRDGQVIPDPDSVADPNIRNLCAVLGNHPYALEIAGSILRRGSSAAKLLEYIAKAPHIIEMPEQLAKPGREGIEKLLTACWIELSPATQAILSAFGAFFAPGASDVLLLSYHKECTENTVQSALADLVNRDLIKSLEVTIDGKVTTYYRLHALTFSYARAIYDKDKGNRLGTADFLEHFASVNAKNFDLLNIELSNLIGAARAALQARQTETATSIVKTLVIDGFVEQRGHAVDVVGVLDAVLDDLRSRRKSDGLSSESLQTLHRLVSKRGNIAFDRGDYPLAVQCYREALSLATENQERTAILLGVLGKAQTFSRDLKQAKQSFRRAYQLAHEFRIREKDPDPGYIEVFVLGQESHAAAQHEDYERTRTIAKRQIKLIEKILHETGPNPDLQTDHCHALINLGSAERDIDETKADQALEIHLKALQVADALKDDVLRANVFSALTEDTAVLKRRDETQKYFAHAKSLWRSIGSEKEVQKLADFVRKSGFDFSTD